MLEITRELVEHYLRAAGWTKDRDDCTAIWTSADHFRSMTDGEVDEPLRHLPRAMCFRLGLCAAAESLLEEARVVNESIARGGPVVDEYDERVGSIRFVVSHITTADSILALAGISADAWESARKR